MCAVAYESQKVMLDPLELELQMVVSCHLCSGNQIWVLGKSRQCFKLLSHLSNPDLNLFIGLFVYFFVCVYVCMVVVVVVGLDLSPGFLNAALAVPRLAI